MKMDHHCPWINTCCGHYNHGYFVYFLFWAPCGCIHATCILIPSIYRALNRVRQRLVFWMSYMYAVVTVPIKFSQTKLILTLLNGRRYVSCPAQIDSFICCV